MSTHNLGDACLRRQQTGAARHHRPGDPTAQRPAAAVQMSVEPVGGAALHERLRGLAQRCAARAKQLQARQALGRRRQGLLFGIGHRRMVVPIDGLAEVLDLPRGIAAVPGTADWVVGIGNHRGELLPIFDLQGLLFGARAASGTQARVLVPRGGRLRFGLLVDEVIGTRAFEPLGRDDAVPDADRLVATLARGIYRDHGDLLPVVDLAAVETLPRFAAADGRARV